MFEDIIATLDGLGVAYEEDYDAGTLTIDIADVDKSTLVEVINAIAGTDFTIDDTSIVISGGEVTSPEVEGSEEALNEAALGDLDLGAMGE